MSEPDVVLLIHGTGSGHDDDEGKLWWQVNSKFCQTLDDVIAPKARCHKKGEVFHWSGKNSEIERRSCGKKLYEYMLQLEEKGTSYHLIGHSHGASIMWHALCNAAKNEDDMKHLKSWLTFGCPFLQYRPQYFNLWLVIPFFLSLFAMVSIAVNYLWPFFPWIRLSWEQIDKVALPVMLFLMFILLLICVYTLFWIIAIVKAIIYDFKFHRYGKKVAMYYSARWMNLCSRHDEGVNGMRSTLNPSSKIIPRWHATAWWLLPVASIYNIFAFFIDEYTWSKVKKSIQGSDVWGVYLDKVSWPYLGDCKDMTLPKDLEEVVVHWANENIRDIVAPLRERAGKFDITQAAPIIIGALEGKELIHSCYYQVDPVIRLMGELINDSQTHDMSFLARTQNLTPDKTHHRAKVDNFMFQVIVLTMLTALALFVWWGTKTFYSIELQLGSLRGAHLHKANLEHTYLKGATFDRADLTEANLRKAHLEETDLREADLWEANLEYADVRHSNIIGANLDGANLDHAHICASDLSGANLRETNLRFTCIKQASLNFCNLENADLHGADLSEAYLWSANMVEANLQNANLTRAKMFYANLVDADLSGANLRGANLTGVNLTGANLKNADFTGAVVSKTIFVNADIAGAKFFGVEGLEPSQLATVKNLSKAQGVGSKGNKK